MISHIPKKQRQRSVLERIYLAGFYDLAKSESRNEFIIWTIAMMLIYASATYRTYTMFREYIISEKSVVILQENDGNASTVVFPKVTVCHTANFNRTYLHDNINIPAELLQKTSLGKNQLIAQFARYLNMFNPFASTGKFDEELIGIMDEIYTKTLADVPYSDFIMAAAQRPNLIFRRCQFDGKPIRCFPLLLPLDIPSCYYVAIKGIDGSLITPSYGFKQGLRFETVVPIKDIFDRMDSEDYFIDQPGIRLQFSDAPGPMADALIFPGNTFAIVEISYSETNLKSNCYRKGHEPLKVRFSLGEYEQDYCIAEILLNRTAELCGCRFVIGDYMPRENECTPKQMYECVLKSTLTAEGDSFFNATKFDIWKAQCRPKCNTRIFNTRASFYSLEPSENTSNLEKELQDDIYTFFSNLGGLLGVYIGFSSIAMAHVVSLILVGWVKVIKIYCVNRPLAYWIRDRIPMFARLQWRETKVCIRKSRRVGIVPTNE